jgi:hypothetical protein
MHGTLTDDTEKLGQDTWFNPYRVPKTERARVVIRDVRAHVQSLEQRDGLRKRARRQADQERFEATVAAIIADLIHVHLSNGKRGAALSF